MLQSGLKLQGARESDKHSSGRRDASASVPRRIGRLEACVVLHFVDRFAMSLRDFGLSSAAVPGGVLGAGPDFEARGARRA